MRISLRLALSGLLLLTVALGQEEEVLKEDVTEEEEAVVSPPKEPQWTRPEEGQEPPTVNTTSGLVSGVLEKAINGKTFFSYYAIPYAKPPVGDRRFKNPEMVEEWEGVRDGTQMPPLCPQFTLVALFTGNVQEVEGDEDCLYLNIFTPKTEDKRPHLPVMVFIHGGAWMSGGSTEYPPHVLLGQDVVLVTINYRLGLLGFLSTEDDVAPGNLGLKDQTLALQWIQKNIPNFGGDVLRTTIFGESAGAGSVHFQILSHQSIGLFQRAIMQSGTALCPWSLGRSHAAVAQYTGQVFNCTAEPEDSEGLVSCLQHVPAKDLVPVLFHFNVWQFHPLLVGPRVDGTFIMQEPTMLMKESRHKHVDLISGINQHEGALITLPMYANEAVRASLKYNFPNVGPVALEFNPEDVSPLNQTIKVFDHYLGGIKLDVLHADNVTQMFTDRYFSMCHDLTSSLHAKNMGRKNYRKKTYRYELRHRGQQSLAGMFSLNVGHSWVSHMDDLFYLFTGGVLWQPLKKEEDLKLRDLLTTMWVNFAATGNPTPDDSLGFIWEDSKENDFRYLALKPKPTMEEDYRQKTRELWESLPLRQNLLLHPEKVGNLHFITEQEVENETNAQSEEQSEAESSETKETETPTEENKQEAEAETVTEADSSEKKKDEL